MVVASALTETRQFFTLYNSLDDTKLYLQKEVYLYVCLYYACLYVCVRACVPVYPSLSICLPICLSVCIDLIFFRG